MTIRDTANAWRTCDGAPDPQTGAQTQAVETMPAGAYIKVGLGANEGDTITWNGAPAILRRRGNWLFPEVINVGPTRATQTNRGADSMTADQAQAVRDAAYLEYCQRTSEEWRTP